MNLGFDYGWIGEVRKMLGDYPEAEAYYTKARDLLLEAGEELYASLYEGNIGWLYKERGDLDRAFRLISGAYETGERHGSPYYISIWASHLAEIHEARGELTEAVEMNGEAYAAAAEAGMDTQRYIVANNLGSQLSALELFGEAEEYYTVALELAGGGASVFSGGPGYIEGPSGRERDCHPPQQCRQCVSSYRRIQKGRPFL